MGFATLNFPASVLRLRVPYGFPSPNLTANVPFPSLASSLPFPHKTSPNFISPVYSQPPLNPHSSGDQQEEEDDEEEEEVSALAVPDSWSDPSKAQEESEWLRVSLHKWLDDEYCPEETNITISKVAADSYHQSLLEKRTDLGEILLKMARELESISYQESFHGAFSSANAAIDLIAQRLEQI